MWSPIKTNLKLKFDLKQRRDLTPACGALMAAMSHLLHCYGMHDNYMCAQLNPLCWPLGGNI